MTEISADISNSQKARDAILASIRQSLTASEPFDKVRREHHPFSQPSLESGKSVPQMLSRSDLVENFRVNLESVGGQCMIANDEDEASNYLSDLIEQRSWHLIAISDSELVGRCADQLNGIEVVRNALRETLFECDLGVTGAQWAIAETGTLVLESDLESHRLTSLVAPVHLCVLKASNIRQTLGEILELTKADLSRTITFITGTSRTSDIELTLAIGVHGPAELHVVVIAD